MTNTTLLFKSRAALPLRPKHGSRQVADPEGESYAAGLADQLYQEGVGSLSEQPYRGEGGWSVDVAANATAFTLCIHWLPLGAPPLSFWVIQIRPHLGPLAGILGTAVPEAAFGMLREALEKIVKAGDSTTELWWSTSEEPVAA